MKKLSRENIVKLFTGNLLSLLVYIINFILNCLFLYYKLFIKHFVHPRILYDIEIYAYTQFSYLDILA
jgi:hypothetical protein